MLTEAAEYFSKMFDGRFKEALNGSAEFPNNDPDAWELLIEWVYEGDLPPLTKPSLDTIFDEEETNECWNRLKLCCVAEK
jgi:hypothetical protein